MTFQINSNDTNAIEQLLHLAKEKFNLQINIINDFTSSPKKTTKWGEFANKMDGLFTPDLVEHLNTSRKEARENFITKLSN